MPDKIVIDLAAKKTEAGWNDAVHDFFVAVTPKVFEWLRWTITLAAISYVATVSESIPLRIVLGVCSILFTLYLFVFFWKFEIRGIPWVRNERTRITLSVIITSILGYASMQLFQSCVSVLTEVTAAQQK